MFSVISSDASVFNESSDDRVFSDSREASVLSDASISVIAVMSVF